MADVAALMLEFNGAVPSKAPNPYTSRGSSPSTFSPNPEPPQDRYTPVTYTYRVTTPEAKQATLNRYLGLGDDYLPINQPPKDHQDHSNKKDEEPENLAYYKLMAAYEHGPSSRKRGEQFADEYVRYCLQSESEGKATPSPPPPPPPAKKRNVCNSCLRPFDDGYYKPASPAASPDSKAHFDASVAQKSRSASPGAGSGISFDVELGTWRVHFERNAEQQALYGSSKKAEEKDGDRLVSESKFADGVEDGGYVDYHNHLNQLRGNGTMFMPMRTKKAAAEEEKKSVGPEDVPPAVRLACERAAMGDSEGSYEEYAAHINALRGNHVVVAPAESSAELSKTEIQTEEKTTTGDVMGDYEAYLDVLRRNHVVIAPSETTKSTMVEVKAEAKAEQKATTGDVMGDYERYLNVSRGNHVVVASPDTPKKWDTKVEAATTAGDVMADYDAFLRNNHVVVPPPKSQSRSPTEEELAERAAAGDMMTGYDDFLRANHVVVPSKTQPQTTDVELAERAAAGDLMAGYDDFLRANHVVLEAEAVDVESTTAVEKQTTMAVVDTDDEDLDMDYVDVCDEEYADYLAANHVTVVKHTDTKKNGSKTAPEVNVRATSYEKYYDFGNVGPAVGPPW